MDGLRAWHRPDRSRLDETEHGDRRTRNAHLFGRSNDDCFRVLIKEELQQTVVLLSHPLEPNEVMKSKIVR
jgi:hypothetical protein